MTFFCAEQFEQFERYKFAIKRNRLSPIGGCLRIKVLGTKEDDIHRAESNSYLIRCYQYKKFI